MITWEIFNLEISEIYSQLSILYIIYIIVYISVVLLDVHIYDNILENLH